MITAYLPLMQKQLFLLWVVEKKLQVILLISQPQDIPSWINKVLPMLEKSCLEIQSAKTFIQDKDLHIKLFPELNETLSTATKSFFQSKNSENDHYDFVLQMNKVGLRYYQKQILQDIDWEVKRGEKWALLGANGCGKSTLLRSINRMNDLVEGCRIEGEYRIGGIDIFDKETDVNVLRKNVGMVFQKPNPFPMSIYDNIAYGLKLRKVPKAEMDARIAKILDLVENASSNKSKSEKFISKFARGYTPAVGAAAEPSCFA